MEPSRQFRTYKVRSQDVGHQITVVVTAQAEGFDPVSAVSSPVAGIDKPIHNVFE